jgi:hypothetical protein
MSGPVSVLKIEPMKRKSGLKTYQLLVDRKDVLDHLLDALAAAAGRRLSWPGKSQVVVDGRELAASGAGSGAYAILNCACGSGAECAGLTDRVDVEHSDEAVLWRYRAPRIGAARAPRVFAFRFHKPQYLRELEKVDPAENLKDLPGYGVHG